MTDSRDGDVTAVVVAVAAGTLPTVTRAHALTCCPSTFLRARLEPPGETGRTVGA